jgi:hypothetical protein
MMMMRFVALNLFFCEPILKTPKYRSILNEEATDLFSAPEMSRSRMVSARASTNGPCMLVQSIILS